MTAVTENKLEHLPAVRPLTTTEIDRVVGGRLVEFVGPPPGSVGGYVLIGGATIGFHLGPNGFHGWFGSLGW
jgi:hypothetical protein